VQMDIEPQPAPAPAGPEADGKLTQDRFVSS
jgi:hypothetical protein